MNTAAPHTHNADPANGPVCSHLLTDEVLVGFGIVGQIVSKCVGMTVINRPGLTAEEKRIAVHHHPQVRTCTVDPDSRPRPGVFRQSEASRVEALAWAEAHAARRSAVAA